MAELKRSAKKKKSMRTFLSWGFCLIVFLALGLALLSLLLASLSLSAGLLAGVTYWLLLAHVGFALSFWLQRSVYDGRLSFIARFFRAKSVVTILCLLYLAGFLHMFFAPKSGDPKKPNQAAQTTPGSCAALRV